MLHIVQVILSGNAKIPKVFLDKVKAESAYVECVKEYWAQSYPAYCDRNGVSPDSFSSAATFIKTLDLVDKSRINYWVVKPDDSGFDKLNLFLDIEKINVIRNHIVRSIKEVQQASHTVKEGLTGILDNIADLAENVNGFDVLVTGDRSVIEPVVDAGLTSSKIPQEEPENLEEKYKTPEWKKYVESVKNMCGSWSEFRLFTRHDWRQDVYGNSTSFEYWEWVAAKIDSCIGKAENAGYSVIEDSDQPGHYKYKSPDGILSEISCNTEEEAWCLASLHSEG
jgi:hypothetical protein